MGLQPPKLVFFWYKFARKEYTPLWDFLQNLAWGRDSQIHTLTPNFTVVAKKCGSPKIAKNGNFLYKFAHKKKFKGGGQKKLDIGAQLQTSLYATTP